MNTIGTKWFSFGLTLALVALGSCGQAEEVKQINNDEVAELQQTGTIVNKLFARSIVGAYTNALGTLYLAILPAYTQTTFFQPLFLARGFNNFGVNKD
jgi:hypothetical protein